MSKVKLDEVKAGKYELTAERWRQVTSKPGEPLNYIQHRKGAILDLNIEDARRLVSAGAVVPKTRTRGSSISAQPTPTPAEVILTDVGADAEKAAAAITAEKAKGDKADTALLEKLEEIVTAPGGKGA